MKKHQESKKRPTVGRGFGGANKPLFHEPPPPKETIVHRAVPAPAPPPPPRKVEPPHPLAGLPIQIAPKRPGKLTRLLSFFRNKAP
jgi:hypothetical protein